MRATLLVALFAIGCGAQVSDSTREHRTDDPSAKGATGGASGAGESAGGASGASGAVGSGGVVQGVADGGPALSAPPPYCIAPCIWDALAACEPPTSAQCLIEWVFPGGFIVCDPTTGWSEDVTYSSADSWNVGIQHDGAECLRVSRTNTPEFGSTISYTGTQEHPGGTQVADGTAATCAQDGELHPERAECATWSLANGVVPRGAGGMPAWCTTVTDGVCSSARP